MFAGEGDAFIGVELDAPVLLDGVHVLVLVEDDVEDEPVHDWEGLDFDGKLVLREPVDSGLDVSRDQKGSSLSLIHI